MVDGASSEASGMLIGRESAWMVLLKPEMSIEWLRGIELEGRVAMGSKAGSNVSSVIDARGETVVASVRGDGRAAPAAASTEAASRGEMRMPEGVRSPRGPRGGSTGSLAGIGSGGTASVGMR